MNSSLITEYLQLINYVKQQYNYHPIWNQMYIFNLDLKTLLIVKILPLLNWYDESVQGNGVGLKVFYNSYYQLYIQLRTLRKLILLGFFPKYRNMIKILEEEIHSFFFILIIRSWSLYNVILHVVTVHMIQAYEL